MTTTPPDARNALAEIVAGNTDAALPEGFFDDQFKATRDEDSALQAAARECGWALSTLVDEIRFDKRQPVVNIINRLSAALSGQENDKLTRPLPVSEQLTAEQALERIADTPFEAMLLTPGWAKEFAAAHLAAIRAEPQPTDKARIAALEAQVEGMRVAGSGTAEEWEQKWIEQQAFNDSLIAKNNRLENERVRLWNKNRDLSASLDVEKAVTDSMRTERDAMRTALKSIAADRDCGCKPSCQCNGPESLEIELDALRDIARAALQSSETTGEKS